MAVRRQLLHLFQEPQVGSAIMVERGAARTANGHSAQQRAKALEKAGERVPSARGLKLEDCALYQCRRCRAVLGDSLHLCAQEEKLRLLVCFKVTNDVAVENELMVCVEGDLIGCTYNVLICRSCETAIGIKPYCSKPLAYLRGLFCLFKDNIICYLFKTKTTIEASLMTCPPVSLKEHVQKLKESLVLVHMRLEQLIKKLEELKEQRTVAEKPGYKARPHGPSIWMYKEEVEPLTGISSTVAYLD
ncbi:protein Mis18-beta [Elgaria multicarinata webbii]|uniref:protein Mis18-beta n=1 Tax=Elgaria multicarinata webbii TaxID=159646 RepID=UPI002FCD0548